MAGYFTADVGGINEDARCLCHATVDMPFDFTQSRGGLGVRIMQMGQIVQGHDHRAVEVVRPERGFVVQIEGLVPQVLVECRLFKQLAFDVVFLSPQLKQLEHKGSRMLRQLWELLVKRYVHGERIDGQDFQLLPADTAAEIAAAPDAAGRARLVCDFLAGMTDGYAARTYKRLFMPDFGSIGDLVG